MGLSPGKGKKKVEAQEVKANKAIDRVATADPLDDRIRAKAVRFNAWQDQTGPKNILDAPDIGQEMDIYGEAQAAADTEMMGGGAGNLSNPANGLWQQQVKELGKNQRYNSRAAGISDAYQRLQARADGQANDTIERKIQRDQTAAGLQQGQLSQYYNRYKVQNPWYQKMFNASLKVANAASGGLRAINGT